MPPKRKIADVSSSKVLENLVFCISGALSTTQAKFAELINENGGTVASSVTKKVTHLVSNDISSNDMRVKKAKENNVFIVKEEFVRDSITAGKKLDEADFDPSKEEKKDNGKEEKKEEKKEKKEEKKEEKEEKEEEEEVAAPAAKKTRGRKKKEEKEKEEKEEEEPVKKTRGRKGKKAKEEQKEEEEEEEEKAEEKEEEKEEKEEKEPEKKEKVIVKGSAAVDKYTGLVETTHVLEDSGGIYDATLNQTNIGNNNNKFYIIQVLEKDGGGQYWIWNRWGRVGEPGQHKLVPTTKPNAIAAFKKKFQEKTKNYWDNRDSFKAVSGKYTLLKIKYGADEQPKKEIAAVDKKGKGKEKESSSSLDSRVQNLIKLIFDLNMMEQTMMEMEFDVNKQPLGNLTKDQIKTGYLILKEIEALLKSNKSGDFSDLSSQFYTNIPHNFGRRKPTVIRTLEEVNKKMKLLEAMADIEIATKLLKESEEADSPIDANYKSLNCDIEPVDNGSDEWDMVQKYVTNTHINGGKPKIKHLYRLNRKGEKDRFTKSAPLGNRKLLWHGSRLTNFVGIISQGLRIAPPEAPASGYRFGKGLYFADIMSLSSVYCRSAGQNDFCMLLADVALGAEKELMHDQYMEKPVPGHHSTKALGKIEPQRSESFNHPDGFIVPSGKVVDSGIKGSSCHEHQYIVYDVSQAHLKYLLHLNWN